LIPFYTVVVNIRNCTWMG